jgi:WD40 repeat protein
VPDPLYRIGTAARAPRTAGRAWLSRNTEPSGEPQTTADAPKKFTGTGGEPKLVRAFNPGDEITTFQLSPDGKQILIGCYGLTVYLYDVASGGLLQKWTQSLRAVGRVLKASNYMRVHAASFSSEGKHVISVSGYGTVRSWDAISGTQLQEMHLNRIFESYAFYPVGYRLAGAGKDGVHVWNLENREEILWIRKPSCSSLRVSPNGKSLLTLVLGDIFMFDAEMGNKLARIDAPDSVGSAAFSSEAGVVVGTCVHEVCIWDAGTGEEKARLRFPAETHLEDAVLNSDGALIAIAAREGPVYVVDVSSGKRLIELESSHRRQGLAFSASGNELFTNGSGGVKMWDLSR